VGQEQETINFGDQKVKSQCHSQQAEVRFGGLAEALFSAILGRVGFLVQSYTLYNFEI